MTETPPMALGSPMGAAAGDTIELAHGGGGEPFDGLPGNEKFCGLFFPRRCRSNLSLQPSNAFVL
jgi:hypothetical protein